MDTPTLKWCKHGQHEVPTSEFSRDNKALDGLQTHCKPCKKDIRAQTVEAKKAKGVDYAGEKICKVCDLSKPRPEFDIDWRNADCLNAVCKVCDKSRLQERKKNLTPVVDPDLSGIKSCTKCKIEKSRTEFNKDQYRSDRLFPWCKACSALNSKNHYENNIPIYVERGSTWNKEHRENNNVSAAKWKKANPERVSTHSAQRRQLINSDMTSEDTLLSTEYRKAIKSDPCYYCGEHKFTMHVDHYIPIALGGTDHWWNLVRACIDCNLSKGTMTGDEFIHKLSIVRYRTRQVLPTSCTCE